MYVSPEDHVRNLESRSGSSGQLLYAHLRYPSAPLSSMSKASWNASAGSENVNVFGLGSEQNV